MQNIDRAITLIKPVEKPLIHYIPRTWKMLLELFLHRGTFNLFTIIVPPMSLAVSSHRSGCHNICTTFVNYLYYQETGPYFLRDTIDPSSTRINQRAYMAQVQKQPDKYPMATVSFVTNGPFYPFHPGPTGVPPFSPNAPCNRSHLFFLGPALDSEIRCFHHTSLLPRYNFCPTSFQDHSSGRYGSIGTHDSTIHQFYVARNENCEKTNR